MPRSFRAISRTRPAQRNAATACRLLAISPGYRVSTAKRVKNFAPPVKRTQFAVVRSKQVHKIAQNVGPWNGNAQLLEQRFQVLFR